MIPAATLEDHGYHLPIDTDVRLVEAIARGAVERFNGAGRGEGAAVPDAGARLHAAPPRLPRLRDAALERVRREPARPGPEPHPPRLRPDPDRERARLEHPAGEHGGAAAERRAPHGDLRVELLPDRHRVARGAGQEHRTSGLGGMAHACELETSLYLAIRPDLVQMDKGRDGDPGVVHARTCSWTGRDGPLSFMPHWSAITESGVTGDAAAGTVEKGRIWLEQARKEIAEFIGEVAVRPRSPGGSTTTEATSPAEEYRSASEPADTCPEVSEATVIQQARGDETGLIEEARERRVRPMTRRELTWGAGRAAVLRRRGRGAGRGAASGTRDGVGHRDPPRDRLRGALERRARDRARRDGARLPGHRADAVPAADRDACR